MVYFVASWCCCLQRYSQILWSFWKIQFGLELYSSWQPEHPAQLSAGDGPQRWSELWWGTTTELQYDRVTAAGSDVPLHPPNTSTSRSCSRAGSHPGAPVLPGSLAELQPLTEWEENGCQKQRAFSDGSGKWSTVSLTSNTVGVRKKVRVLVSSSSKRRTKERGEED